MTASHLKPSMKLGDHVRENYANEEREYRRIWRIPADVPLNNRQQNAVYRNHVRTL